LAHIAGGCGSDCAGGSARRLDVAANAQRLAPALALSAGKGTGSTPTLAKPPIKLRNPIAGGPAQATGGQDHEHAAS
jgi:hypothetical protein